MDLRVFTFSTGSLYLSPKQIIMGRKLFKSGFFRKLFLHSITTYACLTFGRNFYSECPKSIRKGRFGCAVFDREYG